MRGLVFCCQTLLVLSLHVFYPGPDVALAQLNQSTVEDAQVEASLKRALWQLGSSSSAKHGVESSLRTALGTLDEAGYAQSDVAATVRKALTQLGADTRQKDKVALMLIEMCPLSWFLGVDRFYLGCIRLAIAKMAVSLGACMLGVVTWRCACHDSSSVTCILGLLVSAGLVWGVVDFVAIVSNAMKMSDDIHSLGMHAQFDRGHAQVAFVLGIVNILLLIMYAVVGRWVYVWRQKRHIALLKASALKSPLFRTRVPTRGG